MFKKILIILTLALSDAQAFSQVNDKYSLTLDQCIQYSLKNNPGLSGKRLETDISDKYVSIQKGTLLPSISLSSEFSISDQYSQFKEYQTANSNIQIYWPIWQNGKIKTEIKQAKIGYEVSVASFRIDQSNLVYLVNENFVDYLRLQKLSELANNMTKRLSITVDAANERLKIGISKRSDLLKAQTEYSNSKYLAIQFETSKNKALQSLLRISGMPLDTGIIISDSLTNYTDWLEEIAPDSLFDLANQYLPEIQLINKQMDKQLLSVIIEQKKMYPEIGAYGSYNYLKSPVYDSKFFGNVGLSLKMDIFTGWRKKNQIAIEKIKTDQLNCQEQEISRLVISEIQMARLSLLEAREQINNAKMQVESSNESLQTINQQYLNGLSSMLELIDAQYADFRANQNYINALADYYQAIALLKRKTGLIAYAYYN